MTRILIDANLAAMLRQRTEPAELCDESGKAVGRFEPAFDPTQWEIVGPDITDEELDRRAKSDKWYTTREVLAHLRNLEGGV